jgi:hypothetical protein
VQDKPLKLRGRHISEQEKERCREGMKRWWANATPEQRAEHSRASSERMKEKWRRSREAEKVLVEIETELSAEIEELEYQLEKARSGTKIYLPAKRTSNEPRQQKGTEEPNLHQDDDLEDIRIRKRSTSKSASGEETSKDDEVRDV